MAKDGDIIDVMFGWLISLFGWILGLVMKLIVFIVAGTFGFIVGLFKKKEAPQDMPMDEPHH